MNKFNLILLSFILMTIMVIYTSPSQAESFSDAKKSEIEAIIKDYLLNNGDTILESVNKYQAELQEEENKKSAAKAKEFSKKIANLDLPSTGNPKGDVTIIEFFDYNCGYCRKALTELQKVLESDKNIKVVFMDMPILGPPSMEAAKWSLAAHRQGKYFEYHRELLEHNGPKNEKNLEQLAKKVGLDIKQLKKDKDDPKIETTLEGYIEQAREIGIRGTPGFIIDDQIFPGYIPASQINTIIANARR